MPHRLVLSLASVLVIFAVSLPALVQLRRAAAIKPEER